MAGRFLYSQLFVTPSKPTTSQVGKTVIITGSNTGLGKEAARHFVQLGAATVILAVRSIEKGEAAKKDIESTTRRQNVVQVWNLDMSSYQSVLDFADRASRELIRIDVALLNAALMPAKWSYQEKDETTITVNYVSTFLLVFALMPKMIETHTRFNVRPTLSITTSETHEWAKFPERHAPQIMDKLNEKSINGQDVDMLRRYELSKLLGILAMRALCERYPTSQLPVNVNSVNPGLCHSEFNRNGGWVPAILKFFIGRTTECGSRNLVAAGCLGPESHGQYVTNNRVETPGRWVLTAEGWEAQGRVWAELVERLESVKSGITHVGVYDEKA